MDPFETQLNKAAQDIKFTESERELVRARVRAFMELRPIRKGAAAIAHDDRMSFADVFRTFQMRYVPAALAAMLILGGTGISYAAEGAVPGDFLYSVKLHVNEEFVDAFQFSPTARLAWAAERADRRLDEATLLASRGQLTNELQAQVAANFEVQAENVALHTQELEEIDPATAATLSNDFEASLEAHEMILARLAAEAEFEDESAQKLAERVRNAAKQVAAVRLHAEEDLLSQIMTLEGASGEDATTSMTSGDTGDANVRRAAVARMRESALVRIGEAQTALGEIDDSERASLREQARVQLSATQEIFDRGDAELADNDYSGAYTAFRETASQARRITQLLEAEKLFSIAILPSQFFSNASSTEIALDEDATLREQMTVKAHARAKELIMEVQSALLNESSEFPRAGEFLKEAQAFVIRGEIALVNEDIEDALRFFRSAQNRADAAANILSDAAEKDGEPKNTEPETPAVIPEEGDVAAYHAYNNGVHVFQGRVIVPTPCHTLSATSTVSKTLPEQIRLILTIHPPGGDALCVQVLDQKTFTLAVEAAETARLSGVSVDGKSVDFVVEEGTATSSSTGTNPILQLPDLKLQNEDETQEHATFTPSISGAIEMGRTFFSTLR